MADEQARRRVRILHLEDDANDAELIGVALAADGLPVTLQVVATRDEFAAALARGQIDLILSDYAVPGFDGISALHLAHTRAPDIPFIIVSGQLGEEAAVESVRSGATDYVL